MQQSKQIKMTSMYHNMDKSDRYDNEKSRQAHKSIYCIILFVGNQEQIKLIDDHKNQINGNTRGSRGMSMSEFFWDSENVLYHMSNNSICI